MPVLPITSKLTHLPYLAASAVVTRLGVVGARLFVDHPANNKTDFYSREEKYNAFFERLDVELFGTIGYNLAIHLTMDAVAKLQESRLEIPAARGLHANVDIDRQLRNAFLDCYAGKAIKGKRPGNTQLIYRAIFGDANRSSLKAAWKIILNEHGYKGIPRKEAITAAFSKVDPFIKALDKRCSGTWAAGIIMGALFGGVLLQWFNDNVYAKHVVPVLNRAMGITSDSEHHWREKARTEERSKPIMVAMPELVAATQSSLALQPAPTSPQTHHTLSSTEYTPLTLSGHNSPSAFALTTGGQA